MAKQTEAKLPKRQQAWSVDANKLHGLEEAVATVKANAKAKFDESVEISVNLGVDPRHADQQVRGVVNLPSGTGKDVRVAVFVRTWWARTIWPRRCRRATSTSTAASRPRT